LNLNTEENRFDRDTFKDTLLENGIIIRDCSNYVGLKNGFYRIAVKDHQANERLINVLNSML
jgi:histidinol-phosphate/aromatic aminotransferase/cobyric acid decarboxylase-like protein